MSSFKITKQVGSATIEFTETYEDHKELFRKASFITSLPTHCGQCKGGELSFMERTAETKDGRPCAYYSLRCQDEKCRYEFKFGQHTNMKTLFPKGWEPPYSRDTDSFYSSGTQFGSDANFGPPAEFAPDPSAHNTQRHDPLGPDGWRDQPATQPQLRALWAKAKNAGLDEEGLKEYLFNLWGKRCYDAGGSVSTKTLTKEMASETLERLSQEHGT